MSKTLYQEYSINIDSALRNKSLYPNSNSFSIQLNNKLKNVTQIRLASIELPNVSYAISALKKNNTFSIDDVFITILDGNYTEDELIDHVNHSLKLNNVQVTLFYDTTATKVFFDSITNFSLDFSASMFGQILGFNNISYSGKPSYKAEKIFNIIGDSYAFLNVNDYGNIIHNDTSCKYLAKILIDKDKYQVVFDSNQNIARGYAFSQPTSINVFHIELRDKFNALIDLHNVDYSITLSYTCFDNVLCPVEYPLIKSNESTAQKKNVFHITETLHHNDFKNTKHEVKSTVSSSFSFKKKIILALLVGVYCYFYKTINRYIMICWKQPTNNI